MKNFISKMSATGTTSTISTRTGFSDRTRFATAVRAIAGELDNNSSKHHLNGTFTIATVCDADVSMTLSTSSAPSDLPRRRAPPIFTGTEPLKSSRGFSMLSELRNLTQHTLPAKRLHQTCMPHTGAAVDVSGVGNRDCQFEAGQRVLLMQSHKVQNNTLQIVPNYAHSRGTRNH
jgi:hypothetical protein